MPRITVEQLISCLRTNPQYFKRCGAAKLLGESGSKKAFLPLVEALKDPYVRTWAAAALVELGDARAIGPLIEVWAHLEKICTCDAKEQDELLYFQYALEKLTGEKLGCDSKNWRDWWSARNQKSEPDRKPRRKGR